MVVKINHRANIKLLNLDYLQNVRKKQHSYSHVSTFRTERFRTFTKDWHFPCIKDQKINIIFCRLIKIQMKQRNFLYEDKLPSMLKLSRKHKSTISIDGHLWNLWCKPTNLSYVCMCTQAWKTTQKDCIKPSTYTNS